MAPRLYDLGFERGWGCDVGRVRASMRLLLDIMQVVCLPLGGVDRRVPCLCGLCPALLACRPALPCACGRLRGQQATLLLGDWAGSTAVSCKTVGSRNTAMEPTSTTKAHRKGAMPPNLTVPAPRLAPTLLSSRQPLNRPCPPLTKKAPDADSLERFLGSLPLIADVSPGPLSHR